MKETLSWIITHNREVVKIFGKWQLVDLDSSLIDGGKYNKEYKAKKSENLESANNTIVLLKIFLRLLSSIKVESLEPFREPIKLGLTLELIGKDLQWRRLIGAIVNSNYWIL